MAFPASAVSGNSHDFSDTKGHWAEEEIRLASSSRQTNSDRWVDGYPDGTFRPEAEVSRAEFVKMLLAAMYLYSYTDTAEFLHEFSSSAESGRGFTDMGGHWLTGAGWTQTALDFGLIRPDDYPGGAFCPDQPATRLEAAVMIVRVLGLVCPAGQSDQEELPFTDADAIPRELRGFVFQAVEAGVLEGYPDQTFRGDKTVTRAESVKMIFRALGYMEEGVDREVEAFAEEGWTADGGQKQQIKLWLSAPAQLVDGVIYLPARDVYAAYERLHGRTGKDFSWIRWDVENQQFHMNNFVYTLIAGAGDARYGYSPYSSKLDEWSKTFPAPARLLYGELMIPVCGVEGPFCTDIWGEARWDGEAKTLVLPLWNQQTPSS